jgi:hypothetical protein
MEKIKIKCMNNQMVDFNNTKFTKKTMPKIGEVVRCDSGGIYTVAYREYQGHFDEVVIWVK